MTTKVIGVAQQQPMTIVADKVLTPDHEYVPGFVTVMGGSVIAIGAGEPPLRTTPLRLPAGSTVIPGLVDMHVHGAGGGNMTALDPAEFRRARIALLAAGVTSTIASLVTASFEELESAVDFIGGLITDSSDDGAHLVGSHLEGPFLSPAYSGCHDVNFLRLPDPDWMRRILQTGRGTVRMVTLAPELLNAKELVHRLLEEDVVAAMGHSGATFQQTQDAISWGVSVGTHLFNGMMPPHHREPGPALTLLDDPRVTIELINDGIHVHPAVARVVARAAHEGRLALVSDGVAATGAPDGAYMLGGTAIRRFEGRVESADGKSLGGGSVTLDVALRGAVQILGMPLSVAVAAATSVPARALHIEDIAGSLAVGRRADLCVLDQDLQMVAVMFGGHWVKEPPPRNNGDHYPKTETKEF